jgi:anti-anti-sigma factor
MIDGSGAQFSANIGKRSPATVFVHGEVDCATAPVLAERMQEVLQRLHPGQLVVDLADVNFMDCSGITEIVRLLRDAPEGFELVIRHPQGMPRQVLELTGIAALCVIQN